MFSCRKAFWLQLKQLLFVTLFHVLGDEGQIQVFCWVFWVHVRLRTKVALGVKVCHVWFNPVKFPPQSFIWSNYIIFSGGNCFWKQFKKEMWLQNVKNTRKNWFLFGKINSENLTPPVKKVLLFLFTDVPHQSVKGQRSLVSLCSPWRADCAMSSAGQRSRPRLRTTRNCKTLGVLLLKAKQLLEFISCFCNKIYMNKCLKWVSC